MGLARVFDLIDFLRVVVEILAQLIAQVGIGIAVTDDLDGTVGTDRAVVGGEHYGIVALRQELEEFGEHGVAEPRESDATVGAFVVGEFAHHLRLGASVGKHVDEIDDYHVEVVLREVLELLQ